MQDLFNDFRTAQRQFLTAKGRDTGAMEAKGATQAELDAVEEGLSVRLPQVFREFLRAFDTAGAAGEFYCFRMTQVALATSWDQIVTRLGGNDVLRLLLKNRSLLPFADEYGGRHWYCLDLSRSTDDCPIVELNLDCSFEYESNITSDEVAESFAAFLRGEIAKCERELAKRIVEISIRHLEDKEGQTLYELPGLGPKGLGVRILSMSPTELHYAFVDSAGTIVAPKAHGIEPVYRSQQIVYEDGTGPSFVGGGGNGNYTKMWITVSGGHIGPDAEFRFAIELS